MKGLINGNTTDVKFFEGCGCFDEAGKLSGDIRADAVCLDKDPGESALVSAHFLVQCKSISSIVVLDLRASRMTFAPDEPILLTEE